MKKPGRLPKLKRLHGEGPSVSEIVLQGRDAPKVPPLPTATHVIWTLNSVYEVDSKLVKVRRVGGVSSPTQRVGLGWKPFMSIDVAVGRPAIICWSTEDGITRATETSVVQAIETLRVAKDQT